MSVDPNNYDLDELRELAAEEAVREAAESEFRWVEDGGRSVDASDDAESDDDDAGWLDVPGADEAAGSD